MDVARDRADVVGGDDATPAVVEPAHDEDGTEVRQLVVGQRGPASGGGSRTRRRANRRGWSRRGRSRRTRPGSRPARPCPRCRSAGDRRARRHTGRSSSGRTGSPAAGAVGTVAWPGQPSSDACGSQSNVSVSPASRTTRVSVRQEREERVEQGGLPDLSLLRRDDHRDTRLEEEPERRRQLGVEGALADQRDDRAIGGRVGHAPSLRAGRGAGQTASARHTVSAESAGRRPRSRVDAGGSIALALWKNLPV